MKPPMDADARRRDEMAKKTFLAATVPDCRFLEDALAIELSLKAKRTVDKFCHLRSSACIGGSNRP